MLRRMRSAHDRDGNLHDLIEWAGAGLVPDDLLAQVVERLPPEAQPEFIRGFCSACSDHIDNQHLGLEPN